MRRRALARALLAAAVPCLVASGPAASAGVVLVPGERRAFQIEPAGARSSVGPGAEGSTAVLELRLLLPDTAPTNPYGLRLYRQGGTEPLAALAFGPSPRSAHWTDDGRIEAVRIGIPTAALGGLPLEAELLTEPGQPKPATTRLLSARLLDVR